MNETLIILLGTSQQILKNLNERNYKKYIYFNKESSLEFETPFVGEAIIRLFPRFNKLIIIGTNSSMWDYLYTYCKENLDPNYSEEENNIFGKIAFSIEESYSSSTNEKFLMENRKDLLEILSNIVSKKFNIKTEIMIIPIADNEKELWKVFEILSKFEILKSKISFDITHGLRYQPFFIFLTLFYLSLHSKNIKFGSLFYGALELSNQLGNNNKAPIIEFKIFNEMIKWIIAINNFNKYNDVIDIVNLIDNIDELNNLKDSLTEFNLSFNLGYYNQLTDSAAKIFTYFKISESFNNFPNPLKLLKEYILDFITSINQNRNNNIELTKLILIKHYKSGNYGLAFITLWQYLIFLIDKNLKTKMNNQLLQKQLVNIIKNYNKDLDKKLVNNIKELNEIRNSIAHLDFNNKKNDINSLKIKLNDYINYFLNEINFNKLKFIINKIEDLSN